MKIPHRLFVAVAVAASLALGVLPARAQPPQQTPSEKTALVLKKMRDENISAEEAFDDGLLTKDVLLFALGEDGVLDTQPGQWQGSPETMAWAQLLAEKFPESVARPAELPIGVQVKLARWYFSKNDARGVEIMDNILKNLSRENPDMRIASTVISLLARHYSEIGEYEKSIATSLKAQEFTQEPQFLSSFIFTAARTAATAGDTAQAQKLYEQIVETGGGWAKVQSIIALSQILSKQGKVEEARALLQKPLDGDNADEMQIQLDNQIMQTYFQRGEWDEALKWAKTTIEHYDALEKNDRKEMLKWTVENAKRMPEQIAQWKKSPVQLYTREISVRVADGETEPARTYFNVNSYRDITVKAASDNAAIGVWPLQSPENYSANSYQMVGVEITPEAFPKAVGEETKAEITVSFEEFPDTTFKIPVKVVRVENGAKTGDE
jgi:tetratricopeptide (TPR) repeat protein